VRSHDPHLQTGLQIASFRRVASVAAKQSILGQTSVDCLVAEPVIGRAFAQ
jgi:hypothetical protein